jgi:hypothetical protein
MLKQFGFPVTSFLLSESTCMELFETIAKVILGIVAIVAGMVLHQWAWEKKAEYLRGYKYKKIKKRRQYKSKKLTS